MEISKTTFLSSKKMTKWRHLELEALFWTRSLVLDSKDIAKIPLSTAARVVLSNLYAGQGTAIVKTYDITVFCPNISETQLPAA